MIFGKDKLKGVDPKLAEAVQIVATIIPDIQVICGQRGKEDQDKAFADGKSKLRWPKSKHNTLPYSQAVDIAIVRQGKINWGATHDWYYLAGAMILAGKQLGISIKWGNDWDRDCDFNEEKFRDLPHFEIS